MESVTIMQSMGDVLKKYDDKETKDEKNVLTIEMEGNKKTNKHLAAYFGTIGKGKAF